MRSKRYTVLKRFYGNCRAKFQKNAQKKKLVFTLMFQLRFGRAT